MLFNLERQLFLIISIISAAIFWCGESLMHFAVLDYGQPFELIPSDFNELWMRAFISALVIIFGLYVQRQVNKNLDVKEAKMRTLKATMNTVHDRVGNALSGIKMVLGNGKKNNLVDEEIYHQVIAVIDETFDDLQKFSNIEEIKEKRFHNDIYFLEIEK